MNLTEWVDTTLAEADRAAEEKQLREEEAERLKSLETSRRVCAILKEWRVPLYEPFYFSPEGGLCFHQAVLLPYGDKESDNRAINAYMNGQNNWCYNKEEFAAWLRSHLQHIKDEEAFAER